jgi:hypothetical protein
MAATMTAKACRLGAVLGLAVLCSSCIQVLRVELYNATHLRLRIVPSVGEPAVVEPAHTGTFEYHLKLVVDSQHRRWTYAMPASLATSFSPAFIERRERGARFVRMSIAEDGVITVLVPGRSGDLEPCPTQPVGFPLKPVATEASKMSP